MPSRKEKYKGDRQKLKALTRLRYRILLVGVAALVLVLTLTSNIPITIYTVPPSIARSLEENLGVRLQTQRMRCWLFPLALEIEDPQLMLARSGEPESAVWHAQLLRIKVNLLALVTGLGKPLTSVYIESPSPIVFFQKGTRFALENKLRALLENASAHKTGDTPSELPFSHLEVRNAVVAAQATGDPTIALPVRPKALSHETTVGAIMIRELALDEVTGQRYRIKAAGDLQVHDALSEFALRGTILGWNEFAGEVTSPAFRGYWPVGFRGSFATEAREARIDVRLLRQNNVVDCYFDAAASALAIAAPQHGITYQDENVQLSLQLHLQEEQRTATLENVSATSPHIDIRMQGKTQLSETPAYELSVTADRIGAPYIELLNAALPRGFDVGASEGNVSADLHLSGKGTALSSVIGKLSFSTVTLQTPHFKQRIRELSGELDFEPQRVVFHALEGYLGATQLRLQGELEGDYLTSRTGTLRIAWQTTTTARDIAEIVQAAVPGSSYLQKPVTSSWGKIESHGALEQTVTPVVEQWPPPQIKGEIVISNVAFSHPSLPLPLTDLDGRLEIHDAQIDISELQGTMGGNRVNVSGTLRGNRYFWSDPVLTATASVQLDIAQVTEHLPAEQKTMIRQYQPSGLVDMKLNVQVPLLSPSKADITGWGTLTNGAFQISNDYANASVRNVNGAIAWDGKKLSVEKCSADINGTAIQCSGIVNSTEIRLELRGKAQLDNIQRTFPRMEPFVEIHGPVEGQVAVVVSEPSKAQDAPSLTSDLARLVAGLPSRVMRAYENRAVSVTGTLTAGNESEGASFRHHAMPPARTLPYGLAVPRAEIRNIRGKMTLRGNVIEVSEQAPLHCEMADTPNCRLSGKITFEPNQYPRVQFKVETDEEAKLDTWITGWSSAFNPPQRLSLSKKGWRFELEGQIIARHATYKGQKADNSSAHIVYTHVKGEPPSRIEFREVFVNGFGGTIRGEGWMETWKGDPENYPRWEANVNLQHVRIPPVSRIIFRDPETVEGLLTCHLKLQGVRSDIDRLRGEGRATLVEVEVGRLPFILRLFQMINLTQQRGFFEKAVYSSKPDTRFEISEGVLTCDRLELETEGLLLEMRGKYYLSSHQIDALVRLNVFESSLLGALPLVGDLARVADRTLGRMIIAFKVNGPARQPTISPVPLPLFQPPEH